MLGRAWSRSPTSCCWTSDNHLDIDAITWPRRLCWIRRALLFIATIALRARLATRIVELDRGTLRGLAGSYDEYVLQKRAALGSRPSTRRIRQKLLGEVLDSPGLEARRRATKQGARAQKLHPARRTARAHRGRWRFGRRIGAVGKLVFEAVHVTHSSAAAGHRGFSARIQRPRPHRIMAPNGCGKTTLIKPGRGFWTTSGEIRRGTNLLPATSTSNGTAESAAPSWTRHRRQRDTSPRIATRHGATARSAFAALRRRSACLGRSATALMPLSRARQSLQG